MINVENASVLNRSLTISKYYEFSQQRQPLTEKNSQMTCANLLFSVLLKFSIRDES